MADLKQNPTVVVTLRIPLDVYEHLKMLASEYGVSVPVAFRIYLKQLQTNNTQHYTTLQNFTEPYKDFTNKQKM